MRLRFWFEISFHFFHNLAYQLSCFAFILTFFVSDEMCDFFDKRGYPVSVLQADHHLAPRIDWQSALQTSQKENSERIPFILTFDPHNHAAKSIILNSRYW